MILFGVNKLPKLGKGLGDGIRNFKESMRAGQDDASSDKRSNNDDTTEPK